MASLNVNKLLPVIAGTVVVLMATAVFVFSKKNDSRARVVEGESGLTISSVEVDADNTSDTIRALSGHVTKLNSSVVDVSEQNARLELEKKESYRAALTKAKEVESEMDARLAGVEAANMESQQEVLAEFKKMQETILALQKEIANTQAETNKRIATSERKTRQSSQISIDPVSPLKPVSNNKFTSAEILPGLGLGGLNSGATIEGMELLDVVWVNPLDRPNDKTNPGSGIGVRSQNLLRERLPSSNDFNPRLIEVRASSNEGISGNPNYVGSRAQTVVEQDEPFFTLPDLSMFTDAVALTSLVGRVYPEDKEIKDPWPFKVMIGRSNLAANYVQLPLDIDGMLFEGYAIGDWTLGCVRGWITAATFIFSDGTTVSAYSETEGARPDESRFSKTAIGYISDAFGNPCVQGEPVTDAPKFLASRSIAAGLAGYATALNAEAEESQTSIGTNGAINTVTRVLDGSRDYAANSAVAEAFAEGADWVRDRQRQSFDAVYVPPGSPVVVNLQTELRLDKKPNARKVRYSQAQRQVNATLD